MPEGSATTFDAGPQQPMVKFPEVVKVEPCSSNECVNGHKWPPMLQLAQCPGCGGPLIAVKMINCPICNEPTKTVKLRTDHTGMAFGIAALCRGQGGMAESNFICMERHAAKDVEEKWDPETGRMK